jgi:hypothetical protein
MMDPWFRTGTLPDSSDFGTVLMTMLGKPGAADPRDPSQGRPISVDNLFPKIFDAITNSRIAHHVASLGALHPTQIGFLPGRSSDMHVLAHRALVQHCQATNRTLVSLFVDVKGAYPSMDWRALEYLLRKYGIPDDAVRAYMTRLRRTRVTVRNGKSLSAPIPVDKGLQQGQVSAPLSWNIYYDPLLRRIHRLIPGVRVRLVRRSAVPPNPDAGAVSSDEGAAGGTSSDGAAVPPLPPPLPVTAALDESPERAFADDLVIYLVFEGTPTHADVRERLRDVLAILSDYERDFTVALGLGVKKTAIVVSPPDLATMTTAEREKWCSPSFPPVPIPPPGAVWTASGKRRPQAAPTAAPSLPLASVPPSSSRSAAPDGPPQTPRPAPPSAGGSATPQDSGDVTPVAPPPARTVSATSTYKYLGDVFISSQPPAAAREAFVSRLARKLTLTLTRLFSYNRVTLRLCVATKMQLLGTLMMGATSYLLAVHRLTAADADRVEAPVRRALMEILGLPARGGTMQITALMEAPAVVPLDVLSLTHRLRLAFSLYRAPPYAASPPSSLVLRLAGLPAEAIMQPARSRPAILSSLPALPPVAGVTLLRDALSDLRSIGTQATGRDRDGEPPADWTAPATLSAVIPATHRLRITASYYRLGAKYLWRWTQRCPPQVQPPAPQAGPAGTPPRDRAGRRLPQSLYRSPSRVGEVDPRLALVARPPTTQLHHLSAIYFSTCHALASDSGPADASPVTRMSWTGPGGGGRFLALCQLPTSTVSVVARARLGSNCLRLAPFALAADREIPLTSVELDAVCRACKKEAGGPLMLCHGLCGQALHWLPVCARASGAGGIPERSTSRQRGTPPPTGSGPLPSRWFCSAECKSFHDDAVAADAARRLEEPPESRAGCPLCEVAAATDPLLPRNAGNPRRPLPGGPDSVPSTIPDPEDLWHLLFDCRHPVMREARDDRRLSAISHYAAMCEAILAASERALRWYPGDAGALVATRVAVTTAQAVVQSTRDDGATLEPFLVYRLILALPFPEHVLPPYPPPADPLMRKDGGAVAADPFAASRALGRIFDSVRLTSTLSRAVANRAVAWASEQIQKIADTRRAILFPPSVRLPAGPRHRAAARRHDKGEAGSTSDPPMSAPPAASSVGDTLLLVRPQSPD